MSSVNVCVCLWTGFRSVLDQIDCEEFTYQPNLIRYNLMHTGRKQEQVGLHALCLMVISDETLEVELDH
jgi:hypothetical protein